MNKLYLLIIILLALPIVTAITPEYIFTQNNQINLKFSCFDEATGIPCDTLYTCNITVQYPDQTLMIDNAQATRNPSYYNITLTDTTKLGFHQYQTYCTNGTDGGFSPEQYFLINTTGEQIDTGKAILYLFAIITGLFFFVLCLYGAIKLPWKNNRNPQGFIVSVNDYKYLKITLWFFTYLILIFLSFMSENITGVLELGIATNMFRTIFWFLVVFLFPTFVILFITMFASFWNDKKINELLDRNLRIR